MTNNKIFLNVSNEQKEIVIFNHKLSVSLSGIQLTIESSM